MANGQEDVPSELLQFSFVAALPKSGKEVRRKQKKARRKQEGSKKEARRKQKEAEGSEKEIEKDGQEDGGRWEKS